MDTQLDKLLASIDPVRNLDVVSARVDKAINSFQVESSIIKCWDDYKTVLIRFFCHTECIILRIHPPRSPYPDMDWGRSCHLLIKEYGPQGEKAAFEMIRTGSEGGLYAVLKAVAKRMIDTYAGNEISARIAHYWEKLATDEKIAAAQEYVRKYGHLLPSELTEGSAGRILLNFTKVLEEHPRLIKRMRNSVSTTRKSPNQ